VLTGSPGATPPSWRASLAEYRALLAHPRVVAAIAGVWAFAWLVLAAGYAVGTGPASLVLTLATVDAGGWAAVSLLAPAAGWALALGAARPGRRVALAAVIAALLVVLRLAAISTAAPLAGPVPLGFVPLLVRLFPRHFMVASALVGIGWGLRLMLSEPGRLAAVAELEASRARARFDLLRSRIGTGLLLECLDRIAERIPADPAGADALLVETSEMLRRRLAATGAEAVPLGDEVELARAVAELLSAGSAAAAAVHSSLDPSVAAARVPPGVLPAVVECAARSAAAGEVPVRIRIEGERAGARVRLRVRDDLPLGAHARRERPEWAVLEALRSAAEAGPGIELGLEVEDDGPRGASITLSLPVHDG
jgi:hypothetical protein